MKKLIFSNPMLFGKLAVRAAKWHLQYYLTGRAFPMLSGMYITNACNFKCRSCNIWRNKKKSVVSMPHYKSIIDDPSSLGTFYFSISGGEPLLIADLEERVSYAKSKIPYVHFVSNGYLLDAARAKSIAATGVDEVSISIDGIGATHDRIRGQKGAFDHAVQAVKNLRAFAPRVQVVVNSILSPDTVDDLYKVVALTKELGVLHKFQPIIPQPNASVATVTPAAPYIPNLGIIHQLAKILNIKASTPDPNISLWPCLEIKEKPNKWPIYENKHAHTKIRNTPADAPKLSPPIISTITGAPMLITPIIIPTTTVNIANDAQNNLFFFLLPPASRGNTLLTQKYAGCNRFR